LKKKLLSSYIALSNWIWKIYHIDIILRPKLCQFVQFEISPSMSHKVFIFLKITHLWKPAHFFGPSRSRFSDVQWLLASLWFSLSTLVSSTNKTDCHDITEMLLKVAINTKTLIQIPANSVILDSISILLHWWIHSSFLF
jgi:hypothetical protein